MTYNVRRCLGLDGRLWPERIAETIVECDPDVIALQELDVGRARSLGDHGLRNRVERCGLWFSGEMWMCMS